MPDEHNAFDLAKYVADNKIDPMESFCTDGVDLSGRPKPTNVRVQLNSGVVVRCDCRYAGVNPADGDRLFTVIAEIDWENYIPALLIVEEMPTDVEFRFRVPGMPDADAQAICNTLQTVYERIIHVR